MRTTTTTTTTNYAKTWFFVAMHLLTSLTFFVSQIHNRVVKESRKKVLATAATMLSVAGLVTMITKCRSWQGQQWRSRWWLESCTVDVSLNSQHRSNSHTIEWKNEHLLYIWQALSLFQSGTVLRSSRLCVKSLCWFFVLKVFRFSFKSYLVLVFSISSSWRMNDRVQKNNFSFIWLSFEVKK